MIAVNARYDGKKVVLPRLSAAPVGPVIVIFQADTEVADEKYSWLKGQESVFSKAWDNEEDAVYDKARPSETRNLGFFSQTMPTR